MEVHTITINVGYDEDNGKVDWTSITYDGRPFDERCEELLRLAIEYYKKEE